MKTNFENSNYKRNKIKAVFKVQKNDKNIKKIAFSHEY